MVRADPFRKAMAAATPRYKKVGGLAYEYADLLYSEGMQLELSISDRVAAFPIYKAAAAALVHANQEAVDTLVLSARVHGSLMQKHDAAADWHRLVSVAQHSNTPLPLSVYQVLDITKTLVEVGDCAEANRVARSLLVLCGEHQQSPAGSDGYVNLPACRWGATFVTGACHAQDGAWVAAAATYATVRDQIKTAFALQQHALLAAENASRVEIASVIDPHLKSKIYLSLAERSVWAAMASAELMVAAAASAAGPVAATVVATPGSSDSAGVGVGYASALVDRDEFANKITCSAWYTATSDATSQLAAVLPSIGSLHQPTGVIPFLTEVELTRLTVEQFQRQFYAMNRPVLSFCRRQQFLVLLRGVIGGARALLLRNTQAHLQAYLSGSCQH
jgi:hypothetical protein